MNDYEKFWYKIRELQKVKAHYQSHLVHKVDTKKILRAVDLCLENDEILEGGALMYQRNSLIRLATNFIIKYCYQRYVKYTPTQSS